MSEPPLRGGAAEGESRSRSQYSSRCRGTPAVGKTGGCAFRIALIRCRIYETLHEAYRRLAFGTARLSGSVSKYASWAKLKKEAMKLVGIDWIALLYVITESL